MRRTLSWALLPALLLGLTQAPLAHMHRQDPDHGHAVGLAHTHFGPLSHHDPAQPELSGDDDRQTLDWVGLVQDSAQPLVAVVSDDLPLAPPQRVAGLEQTPVPCGHDPPALRSPGSRAPPA